MKKLIRSRILEVFPKECLIEIYKICKSLRINNNNDKADAIMLILDKYKINYIELGPGTNRLGILIDGYVFKIALDKWGIRDNLNDFTVSEELQPYVAKTYETNKLILVAEYVTVISREEFREKRDEMVKILSALSTGYLLGDVGLVEKNFCNWGYRDDGQLVILDYGYVHRIVGHEMMCSYNKGTEEEPNYCGTMLEYDENFHNLYCPRCRKTYTFMDVRRKITTEYEEKENNDALSEAYAVTNPYTEFNYDEEKAGDEIDEEIDEFDFDKEEERMAKKRNYFKSLQEQIEDDYELFTDEAQEDAYLRALELMSGEKVYRESDAIEQMVAEIEGANQESNVLTMSTDEVEKYTEKVEEYEESQKEDKEIMNDINNRMEQFFNSGEGDDYFDEDEEEENNDEEWEYNEEEKQYVLIKDSNNQETEMFVNPEKKEQIENVKDVEYHHVTEEKNDIVKVDTQALKESMTAIDEEPDYSKFNDCGLNNNDEPEKVSEHNIVDDMNMVDLINKAKQEK